MRTLGRVQRGIEALYRVETGCSVGDYVVGTQYRDELVCEPSPANTGRGAAAKVSRRPREQLLVVEHDGEMNVALYLDPSIIANLDQNDPSRRLGDHNFGDFLLAIEGVSHFIYTVCCARAERPVSQLELELQAEVDKYVTCLLTMEAETGLSEQLRYRLFDAHYDEDLDADEQHRYRAANDNAHRYASWLEETFVSPRRIPEMLAELRRFYRQGLAAKLSTIARAA